MLNLKSIYPIGIDIGHRNIYAAQVKPTRKGLAVRGMVHRELNGEIKEDTPDSSALIPILKEILKGNRFVGKRAVVHIPPKFIFSFPIRFQVEASETLEEAIVRKSKEYLPFPIEEAIIDYPSIVYPSSSDENQYKTTIIAVHRNHINQFLQILKEAGLTVEAVDFGVISLIRLHHYLHDSNVDPVILCNIDYADSLLSVVTEDRILAHRHISWGVERLLTRIQDSLGLSHEKDEAKFLLKEYGLLHEDQKKPMDGDQSSESREIEDLHRAIYQIITPYCEELVGEVHKVISYLRAEKETTDYEGIYLYGQGFFIKHLDSYIEKRIDIPARLINPTTKIPLSKKNILSDISRWAPFAMALGLAMRKVTWL